MSQICNYCHHHCLLQEGKTGFCRVRTLQEGKNICGNYGFITSLALDPVEKKPLNRFYPGTWILSMGSYGCNLRCPFCQNFSISQNGRDAFPPVIATPEQLASKAAELKSRNNIGIAFTYNEPLLSWEFIRDTGRLVHENGQKNVVVTNGNFSVEIAENLAGIVDAYNIDLKGFTPEWYRKLGGDLEMAKAFIMEAVKNAHVELTTLIVPGENDTPEEMESIARWIASLSPDIPLHVSKFFPRWNMVDRNETPAGRVYRLAEVAKNYLQFVYTGNC
ncbi:MAG: AmmeMemoRadiSam system radical SAM enzyme [Acidaminococcaceae bacterium]|nr:AmmeMemoRadiSam system radical SAM enzyme [Acidaminococcaceae bacterium]MBQ9256073.1 AmmeMemoRadiSam system radical SAM enzyme [Acidaminococcaceae bacterium]MBQ9283483.1 AmmeMemoRadiSam system radical SAM enzyme [Acidaminococcaceae bacterium]MBQ9320715.1 AmmeMemoRadiSam system radical SAM enzyme [Acidaminococcaceae bacterium]MBR1511512.1 AmmeMemoRadiSam system radical SAM enzyme [Acidaminococcaceae bacterium]